MLSTKALFTVHFHMGKMFVDSIDIKAQARTASKRRRHKADVVSNAKPTDRVAQ